MSRRRLAPSPKKLVACALGAALLGAFAVLGAACPDAAEKVENRSAADHGEALVGDATITNTAFNQMSCSTCHDARAGDGDGKKAGAPLAGALSRPTYWGGTEDTLLGSINACLYYFMLANDPWTGEEEEAKAIYAYLEDLDENAGDDAKAAQPFTIGPVDAPTTGNKVRGESLYADVCADCHGSKSTGKDRLVDRAPILPDDTLKAHPDPTYTASDRRLVFIEKTRHGGFRGYGGQMPPISEEVLSDEDLGDILAYLGVPTQ